MGGETAATEEARLVGELSAVWRAGLTQLRDLSVPMLTAAAEQVTEADGAWTPTRIERLLREAIAAMDAGEYGDAALELFGLQQGTRAWSSARRRTAAAGRLERSADTFQRSYEANLLNDLADNITALARTSRLRQARTQLERREPAESRLAVQWVERFEAYHRIWTPAWALGADLTAYRATLLDPNRPYDEPAGAKGPDDPGYTQELQAEGYAKYALYRWAWFEWHVRQFTIERGGLWLLSSAEAEIAVADHVYEIGWHITALNERDRSWLRNAVAQTKGQELDHFQTLIASTSTGSRLLDDWLGWCSLCSCTWTPGAERDGRFPTLHTEPGIAADCQLHQVVAHCNAYCTLIEAEWLKIADWYHLDSSYSYGVRASDLYQDWSHPDE